jgi:hypothetical protein
MDVSFIFLNQIYFHCVQKLEYKIELPSFAVDPERCALIIHAVPREVRTRPREKLNFQAMSAVDTCTGSYFRRTYPQRTV